MSHLAEIYDTDYNAWAKRNAELLRQGKFEQADMLHLIEELEGMGNSHKNEILSRLRVLLAHLLKWQYQLSQLTELWEKFSGSSWRGTLIEQRAQIAATLEENPGLKPYLAELVQKAYPVAVKIAAEETGLPKNTFPKQCPYTVQQILADDFYPNNP